MNTTIEALYTDILKRTVFPARVTIVEGKILSVEPIDVAPERYILPGFVDAHVHIESSMLPPAEFARLATVHGTVATVSDPHEIANVCGRQGVDWMIGNAAGSPLKIAFGAPSCVPATPFETAGATLDVADIAALLASPDIHYLAEVMNYPGVLSGDAGVTGKIDAAKQLGKPVDGHAPGLAGQDARAYATAGITTDHECSTLEEALGKIACGMKILIREGSAARNFEALHPLLGMHPDKVMFCSDDKHPDELILHHINETVRRSVALGYDVFDVLRVACLHPVSHYQLGVGLLQKGDPADFIIVNNLVEFRVEETWIDGVCVARKGESLLPFLAPDPVNRFAAEPILPDSLVFPAPAGQMRMIQAINGQLLTRSFCELPSVIRGEAVSDTARDLLKIVVLNRYTPGMPPAVAFIRGFGLASGAIASTVAHDCHNIIAVGVDDQCLSAAINGVIRAQGGIAVARGAEDVDLLPLPLAGLMSDEEGAATAAAYARLDGAAKALGSPLDAPFMTLSFMALLVIPALKLSDKGLFDGERFAFVEQRQLA